MSGGWFERKLVLREEVSLESLVLVARRRYSGVVKVVLAAGAVATSIGAIVALWPDSDPPPAILDVEFSDVTVD